MMASQKTYLKNIALVGGTGNLGKYILTSLLATNRFTVTVLTRNAPTDGNNPYPANVKVHAGDYSDDTFLATALAGQDALVITLGFMAPEDTQTRLIAAAAKAGIEWILPNEWGSENSHPGIWEWVPVAKAKQPFLDQVEREGKSWIGVVCNPWYDYSMRMGMFGVNVKEKTATLYDEGEVKFDTATLPMTGKVVAALLSLPIKASSTGEKALENYKNKYAFVTSFTVSQKDILAAVQKATGTSSDEWKVSKASAQENLDDATKKFNEGDRMAMVRLIFGVLFKEGLGGEYSSRHETLNKALGISEDNLDEVTKNVLDTM